MVLSPCDTERRALRRFWRSGATEKPSDNSPWLADELSHGTAVSSCSSLKTRFDTGPVLFWLVLTCFQLTCQSFNFDLYTDDCLYQAFGEIRWRIINGPGIAHARLMLICKSMEMMFQPSRILNNTSSPFCMDSQIVPCWNNPTCFCLGLIP